MLQLLKQIAEWVDQMGQNLSPSRFLIGPWVEVASLSVVFTAFCIVVLKYTLLRKPFKKATDKLAAASYAMLLYRRRPVRVFRGAAGVLVGSSLLLGLLIPAILISGGVLGLAWNTLSNRYEYRPLDVGRPVAMCISVPADQAREASSMDPRIDTAIAQVTASVTAPIINSTWLRVVPTTAGLHSVAIEGVGNVMLNVGESQSPALTVQSVGPVNVIIDYPHAGWAGIGRYGWVVWFLVVCAVVSIPLARVARLPL